MINLDRKAGKATAADTAPAVRLVHSHEEVQRIIRDACTQYETGAVPLEVLVEHRDDPRKYRMRYRTFRVPVSGLVGRVSGQQARDFVGAALYQMRQQLQQTAATGDWFIAAWEVVSSARRRRHRMDAPAPDAEYNIFSGAPSPQKTRQVWVEEPEYTVCCVWIDGSGNQEEDNWHERTGKSGSGLENYLNGKGPLPPSLRKERAQAVDLLMRWAVFKTADQVLEDDEEPVKSRDLTDDELTIAAAMRESGGDYKMIERALNVPWQTVRAALRKLEPVSIPRDPKADPDAE